MERHRLDLFLLLLVDQGLGVACWWLLGRTIRVYRHHGELGVFGHSNDKGDQILLGILVSRVTGTRSIGFRADPCLD